MFWITPLETHTYMSVNVLGVSGTSTIDDVAASGSLSTPMVIGFAVSFGLVCIVVLVLGVLYYRKKMMMYTLRSPASTAPASMRSRTSTVVTQDVFRGGRKDDFDFEKEADYLPVHRQMSFTTPFPDTVSREQSSAFSDYNDSPSVDSFLFSPATPHTRARQHAKQSEYPPRRLDFESSPRDSEICYSVMSAARSPNLPAAGSVHRPGPPNMPLPVPQFDTTFRVQSARFPSVAVPTSSGPPRYSNLSGVSQAPVPQERKFNWQDNNE